MHADDCIWVLPSISGEALGVFRELVGCRFPRFLTTRRRMSCNPLEVLESVLLEMENARFPVLRAACGDNRSTGQRLDSDFFDSNFKSRLIFFQLVFLISNHTYFFRLSFFFKHDSTAIFYPTHFFSLQHFFYKLRCILQLSTYVLSFTTCFYHRSVFVRKGTP